MLHNEAPHESNSNPLSEVRSQLAKKYQQDILPDKKAAIDIVVTQATELDKKMNEFKADFYKIFNDATLYLGSIESLQNKCTTLNENILKLYESEVKNEVLKKIVFIQEQFLNLINEIRLLTKACDEKFLTPAWNEVWNIKNSLNKEKLRLDNRWPQEIKEYTLKIINDDKLEELFQKALQSCTDNNVRERLRRNFSYVSQFTHEIANKKVYKEYCKSTEETLDLIIGGYLYALDKSDSKLNKHQFELADIKFLLTHPLATADLCVFISVKSSEYWENRIFFIRANSLETGDQFFKAIKKIIDTPLTIGLKPINYIIGKFHVSSLMEQVIKNKDYASIQLLLNSKTNLTFLKSKLAIHIFNDSLQVETTLTSVFSFQAYQINEKSNHQYNKNDFFVENLDSVVELIVKNDDAVSFNYLKKAKPQILNISIVNKHSLSLLEYAVEINRPNIIDSLIIDDNVDINQITLHDAAKIGHVNLIKHLLKNKAAINKKDIQGYTPLVIAIQSKQLEAAELLLRNQAAMLDEKEDSNAIMPICLFTALCTWDLTVFETILTYFLLGKDKKKTTQAVFEWLFDLKNLDKLGTELYEAFKQHGGYKIYHYLNKELGGSKWDLIRKFPSIIKPVEPTTENKISGLSYISTALTDLLYDRSIFDLQNDVDEQGNNILHHLIITHSTDYGSSDADKLVKDQLRVKINNNGQTPYHYACQIYAKSDDVTIKNIILKNIRSMYDTLIKLRDHIKRDIFDNLPIDYLLTCSSLKNELNKIDFGIVFKGLFISFLHSTDKNGNTWVHRSILQLNNDNFEELLSILRFNLRSLDNIENENTLLYIAVINNKIDHARALCKHLPWLVKYTTKAINDKILLEHAENNPDMLKLLAEESGITRLSNNDLANAITSYTNYKATSSASGWIQTASEIAAINDIQNQTNDYCRFLSAWKYATGTHDNDFFQKLILILLRHSIMQVNQESVRKLFISLKFEASMRIQSHDILLNVTLSFILTNKIFDNVRALLISMPNLVNYIDKIDDKVLLNHAKTETDMELLSNIPVITLHSAVEKESLKLLKKLLSNDKHININQKDQNGDTPLILAIKQNQMLIAETLLENGAEINDIVYDEMISSKSIPSTLKAAIFTWNLNTFNTIFTYYLKSKDKPLTAKTVSQHQFLNFEGIDEQLAAKKVMDWLLNFDNLNSSAGMFKDSLHQAFQIYLTVAEKQGKDVWYLVSEFKKREHHQKFEYYFLNIIFPYLFLPDLKGNTIVEQGMHSLSLKDLTWIIEFLKKQKNVSVGYCETLLYAAVVHDKIEHTRLIFDELPFLPKCITHTVNGKNLFDHAISIEMSNLLAEKNYTSLTYTEYSKANQAYKNYKNSLPFRWFKTSEDTKLVRKMLKEEKNNYQRFLIAELFIQKHDNKFSDLLSEVMKKK